MFFTLAGIEISVNFVQCLNAEVSIVSTLSGITMDSRFSQFSNAFLPMLVRLSGRLISSSALKE